MLFLKTLCMMNWLKKLMQLIQTNKILKKMIDHFDKKIPDTMKFFETREFIRLIKINVKQK